MKPSDLALLETQLRDALGISGSLEISRQVSGGDINRAALARLGRQECFIKFNEARLENMFAAEARALATMAASGTLKVPRPICHGSGIEDAWLALEYLPMRNSGDAIALGRGLAAMHRVTADAHGWPQDNYIGTTPQPNATLRDWAAFWWGRRLGFQIRMAVDAGHGHELSRAGDRLEGALPHLLAGHDPAPSLLHGDLWGGNHAYLDDGTPVLFDPASYYGDRETDLAMSELFGGFDPAFMPAYREAWPLPDGYPLRRDLYQLYHLLNHLNLFGAVWLSRCLALMDRLAAAVG